MENLKLQKTLLAVSAAAAVAGLLVYGPAHADNNRGNLSYSARIDDKFTLSTCRLDFGDPASNSAASKTVNLGNIPLDSTAGVVTNAAVGGYTTFDIRLKNAAGTGNCDITTVNWDLGVNVPTSQYTLGLAGRTWLTNQAPSGVGAANLALQVYANKNGAGNIVPVDFSYKTAKYGTLLSGMLIPDLTATDFFRINVRFFKTGAISSPITVGTFQANLAMTIFYN